MESAYGARPNRIASFAIIALLHGVAIASLLAVPPARQRWEAITPLFVVFVAEAPATTAAPLRIATPRLHEPTAVALPLPRIDWPNESASTVQTSAATPVAAPIPAATPAAASASKLLLEPPRHDVAYLRNPSPAYPPLSRRLREQGRVMLRVRVSAEGEAQEVLVQSSSGSPRLDQAAVEAVRRWRFLPARRGDAPESAFAFVPIRFALDA